MQKPVQDHSSLTPFTWNVGGLRGCIGKGLVDTWQKETALSIPPVLLSGRIPPRAKAEIENILECVKRIMRRRRVVCLDAENLSPPMTTAHPHCVIAQSPPTPSMPFYFGAPTKSALTDGTGDNVCVGLGGQ